MSTRLRQSQKDSLLRDLTEALYRDESLVIQKRAQALVLHAYEQYVPLDQRKLLKQVDPKFLLLHSSLGPRIKRREDDPEPVDLELPSFRNGYPRDVKMETALACDTVSFPVVDAVLYKHVVRLKADALKLNQRRAKLLEAVTPLIYGSSTVEALRAKWPTDVPMPDGWASTLAEQSTTSNLPAVPLPKRMLRQALGIAQ